MVLAPTVSLADATRYRCIPRLNVTSFHISTSSFFLAHVSIFSPQLGKTLMPYDGGGSSGSFVLAGLPFLRACGGLGIAFTSWATALDSSSSVLAMLRFPAIRLQTPDA